MWMRSGTQGNKWRFVDLTFQSDKPIQVSILHDFPFLFDLVTFTHLVAVCYRSCSRGYTGEHIH